MVAEKSVEDVVLSMKGPQFRITELDSLRGIAALVVVLFHYTTKYEEISQTGHTTALFSMSFGHYGVDFFFIISGFVILMTLTKVKSGAQFVYNRIVRLFPTFWVSMTITFAVTSLFGVERLQRSLTEYLVNGTMVPGLLGVRLVDGVYWSLTVEILFYAFMLVLFLTKALKKIEIVGFFWLILMVLNDLFPSASESLGILVSILNLKYGMLFLMGVNFYKIYKSESNFLNHLQIALSVLIAFMLDPSFEYGGVLLFSIIIFYLFCFDKLKYLKVAPLLYLGKISYSWYLIHQFIGFVIITFLIEQGITNGLILLIMPLFLTIATAHFISKYVEAPSNTYFKKLYKKLVSN